MHARIAEVLNYLISARVHLDSAIAAVPPDGRAIAPSPDRWSVAHVIQHLALTESGIARLFEKRVADARAAGIGPDPDTRSILWTLDVHSIIDRRTRLEAPARIVPGEIVAADDAMRAFAEAHQRLAAAIGGADGVALDRISYPHQFLGPINLYQWGIFAAAHEMRHAAQIREMGTAG